MAYNFSDEQVLKAIEGSRGVMVRVAKGLAIDRRTAKKIVEGNQLYKDALEDARFFVLDAIEDKLWSNIVIGDLPSMKYYNAVYGGRLMQLDHLREVSTVNHTGEINHSSKIEIESKHDVVIRNLTAEDIENLANNYVKLVEELGGQKAIGEANADN